MCQNFSKMHMPLYKRIKVLESKGVKYLTIITDIAFLAFLSNHKDGFSSTLLPCPGKDYNLNVSALFLQGSLVYWATNGSLTCIQVNLCTMLSFSK